MAQSIYDITLASSVLIEEYQSKGYSDYLQVLLLANDKISQAILKTNGNWTASKLNEIKRLINDEITKSYGGLFEQLQDESVAIATINQNAVLGYASLATTLPEYAVKDLIKSTRLIQMSEDSQYEFKKLLEGTKETNIRVLRNTLAGLVATGKTPQEIARDLTFKSNKLSKGQIRSNIFTIVTDAKNQGNYQGYKELENRGLIKYYEHVSTLDSRTSDICMRLDGRKYYQKIDDIPSGLKPPIHGNCRSQLVPRTTDDQQLRASQNGQIPEEKFPTWFVKQPKSFQRTALGNRKYKLYQDGIYKIESLPDVIGKKKRTLKQYQDSLFNFVKS